MKKLALLFAFSLIAFGCNKTIKTKLQVHRSQKLIVKERDFHVYVPEGTYGLTLKIENSSKKMSEMIIHDPITNDVLVRADLQLPPADEVLQSLDNTELESYELQQEFSLLIQRRVDFKEDHYGISFFSPDRKKNLASASFGYKPKEANFDEETQSYLRSYQNVKRRHRAVVLAIDADLDRTLDLPELFSESLDIVANYGAALLMAPWAYVRYAEVAWILGDRTADSNYVSKTWTRVFRKSPVVDFMAFTHSGRDEDMAYEMKGLGKKENQLRYVYTSACSSGSAEHYIADYNAAVAVGHAKMSASPLFSFSIYRNWNYGRSLSSSLYRSFQRGRDRAHLIGMLGRSQIEEHWDNVEDMIDSSEPMVSWTPELPPNQIFVNLSAVPNRENVIERRVIKMAARHTNNLSRSHQVMVAELPN